MKVLVVHDRPEILQQIVDLIVERGVTADRVMTAEDGAGARRLLSEHTFDLAVFDLTIPSVKGYSQPGYSTAEDIFLELFRTDTYNIPGDVIGVTREAGALTSINTSIGPHLMAIVQEGEDGDWLKQLSDRVTYTLRSSAVRLRSASTRYEYDALLITALDEEMRPLRDLFQLVPVAGFPGAHSFMFTDRSETIRRGVAFSVGAAGQASCASATQALIDRFRPRLALMSGFCGGYHKKTKAGEVLLFQSVHDWDTGKWSYDPQQAAQDGKHQDPHFLPRPEPLTIKGERASRAARYIIENGIHEQVRVLQQVRALSSNAINDLKFTLATVASGSAVIANSDVLRRIRSGNDRILGIDMEAYGFYYACANGPGARPDMLCIKAVADFCDGEKSDALHAACCYVAAKTSEELLKKRWSFTGEEV